MGSNWIWETKNMASADRLAGPSAIPAADCREQSRPFTLRIPQILPDEIVCGHLARVYRINGLTRNTRPFHSWVLNKLHKSDRNHNFAKLEMEAVACDMSIEKTARLHTTLPFARFIKRGDETFPASTGYARPPSGLWEPPSCSFGKFCPDCVEEDLDFWGFAYARRTHLLPGVYWCTKHGTCLKIWQNYFFSPLAFPAGVVWSHYPSLAEVPVLIRRYVEMSTQLLSDAASFSVQQAHSRLIRRMEELELDCSQTSLDCLFSRYPSAWLHQVSRHDLSSESRQTCFSVESLLNPRPRPLSPEKYVLLLALLFESSDAAFGYLGMAASEGLHQNLQIP